MGGATERLFASNETRGPVGRFDQVQAGLVRWVGGEGCRWAFPWPTQKLVVVDEALRDEWVFAQVLHSPVRRGGPVF